MKAIITEKKCYRCDRILNISEFRLRKFKGKMGRTSFCKSCEAEDNRKRLELGKKKDPVRFSEYKDKYYAKHRDEILARNKEKYRCNKETWIKSDLKRKYGLTISDYQFMVNKQNGKCAICGKIPNGRLSVDHNHKTGKNRGLLCHECNKGIGLLYEDKNILISAIKYLESYAA